MNELNEYAKQQEKVMELLKSFKEKEQTLLKKEYELKERLAKETNYRKAYKLALEIDKVIYATTMIGSVLQKYNLEIE